MSKQRKLSRKDLIKEIADQKCLLLVCGSSFLRSQLYKEIEKLQTNVNIFTDFSPNPNVQSMDKGIEAFHQSGADTILAAGGGECVACHA